MALGQAVVDITGNTRPLQGEIRSLSGSLRTAILGSAVGNVIADGISSITQRVVDLGRSVGSTVLRGGLSRVLDTENAIVMFHQMGLSIRETDALMDQLRDTFRESPFAYPDVFNISSQLLASGVELNRLNDTMRNVGNMAAFAQSDLNEIGEIFVKISAEGRLSTLRMDQFGTRGVNMAALLAESMGVTEERFRAMVSAGEVSSDMMHDLLGDSTQLAAAMINFADTSRGAWAIFTTGLAGIGEALLEPWFGKDGTFVEFMREVNTVLFGSVIPAVSSASERFHEFAIGLRDDVEPVIQDVADRLLGLRDAFQPVVDWIVDNRAEILRFAGVFTGIVAAIGTVMTVVRALAVVLGALTGPVGLTILAIAGLALILTTAWENSERFRDVVTGAFERVQEVGKTVFGGIARLFREDLLPALRRVWESLQENFLPILTRVADTVLDRFLTALERVWKFLEGSLIPTLAGWWEFLATNIVPILADIAEVVIDDLVWAWDKLWEVLDNLVIPALERAFEIFRDNILPVLTRVAEFVRDEVIPRWRTLREELREVGDTVQERFLIPIQTAIGWIKDNVLPVLREKGEILQDRVGAAIERVTELWEDHLRPALERIVEIWNESLRPALEELWQEIDGPVMTALKALGMLIGGAVYLAILGFINALIFAIEIFTNVVNGIVTVIEWVQKIRDTITRAWGAIRGANDGLIGSFNTFFDTVSRIASQILGVMTRLPGQIRNALSGFGSLLVGRGRELISGLHTGVTDRWASARTWLAGTGGRARTAVGNLRSTLYNAGVDLVRGFIGGITAWATRAADAARTVVNGAINAAKNALGIRSPSRVFQEIGVDTLRGLAEGLAHTQLVDQAMAGVIDRVRLPGVEMVGDGASLARSVRVGAAPAPAPLEVAGERPMNFEVRVYVGDREITDIVRTEINEHDRALDRRVTAGTGGFRL